VLIFIDALYTLYDVDFHNISGKTFTIHNEIGLCTNSQIYTTTEFPFDADTMKYCLCCGDRYNPTKELNCPTNIFEPTSTTGLFSVVI
jgi:hypothetical protein